MEESAQKTHIKAYIDDLIALCYILDNLEEFNYNLMNLMYKPKDNYLYNIREISNGKFLFRTTKEKIFYKENQIVIDIINKHSEIFRFLSDNYKNNGDMKPNWEFFYQYFLEHQNELDQILFLLIKLQRLGFKEIKFNKSLDFTNNQYEISTWFSNNYGFCFLENMEVIPQYEEDKIKYRTTGSNYEMKIFPESINEIYINGREITVNNLLFDATLLPNKLSKETVFDPIISLSEKRKEQYDAIRNSVDLIVNTENLEVEFLNLSNTVEKLEYFKIREELQNSLLKIRENLDKIKSLNVQYDESVVEEYPNITPEQLNDEYTRYMARKMNS